MKELGIGLLGFGTVGAGVVEALQRNGDLIAARCGVRPVLRRIADLDLERDRGVKVDRSVLTTDARSVVADPQIDIVIELIGGVGIAKDLVTRALEAGKPVVTANKKLLAEYGRDLFALAAAKGAELAFEASVGGGIPCIRALREGLVANRVTSLSGILNGTCNYILTKMEQEGRAFDDVLQEAQAAGYAEAEPSLDIDGHDTAHKAAVLAMLAYGRTFPMSDVHVEGIRGLAQEDLLYAGELGYRIKLLAMIRDEGRGVGVRVYPALVRRDHLLAQVSGVFNAVLISGDIVGDTLYYGRGAGRLPTASAVLSDVADVAQRLAAGPLHARPNPCSLNEAVRIAPLEQSSTRSYLRLNVIDRPGVLAKISAVLGRHQISIASMMQKEERRGDIVPVVMLTHEAGEQNCLAALAEIDALDVVKGRTVRIRIADFS
jgi:homoserine dehydrogenase